MHTFVQHKHKAHNYGKHHTHLHAHPTQWSPCSVQGYTLSALQPLASHTGVLQSHCHLIRMTQSTCLCTEPGIGQPSPVNTQYRKVAVEKTQHVYSRRESNLVQVTPTMRCVRVMFHCMGLCERAVLGSPKAPQKGVAPARSTSSTYPPEPLLPTATTHLPSLPSTGPLSVAEHEGAMSLASFSRDRAAISFNCRSRVRVRGS